MSTLPLTHRSPFSLRNILLADAATCVAMGLLLVAGAEPLAKLLSLPKPLLTYAGAALLPVAAFIVWVATRTRPNVPATWFVIVGNVAWVLASFALLVSGWVSPSALGEVFVGAQAVAVAIFAAVECRAVLAGGGGR